MRPVIVTGARVNNLAGVDLALHFGTMVAFTGPSGSGKSSLAFDVLYAEAHRLGRARGVSRVFRHSGGLCDVRNLPGATVGMEQQLVSRPGEPRRLAPREQKWLRDAGFLTIDPFRAPSTTQERMLRFLASLQGLAEPALAILDEPCAGLVPAEAAAVAKLLASLARDAGHLVVAVDHMPQIMEAADRVIAFGPGSGADGGHITFDGPSHLYRGSHHAAIPVPERGALPLRSLRLSAALRDWFGSAGEVEVAIPLHRLVCVAGRAGSGKTAFLEAMRTITDKTPDAWLGRRSIVWRKGNEHVRRSHLISADPIGYHPGSTPATYMGIWDTVREIFAASGKTGGERMTPLDFSFNSEKGRCPRCRGRGWTGEGVFDECPECGGTRYNPRVLTRRISGRTIADVNGMTVREARDFFNDCPRITRKLDHLMETGLGYLTLGQPSNSLSGGEAQRIRIAALLCKRLGDRSLYILDNPARGLDSASVAALIASLHGLVARNNTVLIAENRPEMLETADWAIVLERKAGALCSAAFAGPPGECPAKIRRRLGYSTRA